MISVGSPRKFGRSKQPHDPRRNQTSNSNVHSINPSLYLGDRGPPSLQGLVTTLMNGNEGRVLVGDVRMNEDTMEDETDGERDLVGR